MPSSLLLNASKCLLLECIFVLFCGFLDCFDFLFFAIFEREKEEEGGEIRCVECYTGRIWEDGREYDQNKLHKKS